METFNRVFGKPVPATLCEDIAYYDISGAKRTWSKGMLVRIYVVPCNSAYSNGKGFISRTKQDNYLAVFGQDSVSITNKQFKAID